MSSTPSKDPNQKGQCLAEMLAFWFYGGSDSSPLDNPEVDSPPPHGGSPLAGQTRYAVCPSPLTAVGDFGEGWARVSERPDPAPGRHLCPGSPTGPQGAGRSPSPTPSGLPGTRVGSPPPHEAPSLGVNLSPRLIIDLLHFRLRRFSQPQERVLHIQTRRYYRSPGAQKSDILAYY